MPYLIRYYFVFLILLSNASTVTAEATKDTEASKPMLHLPYNNEELTLPGQHFTDVILDGRKANLSGFFARTTVRIKIRDKVNNTNSCSEVIISNTHILTSGHCFGDSESEVFVKFGAADNSNMIKKKAIAYRFYKGVENKTPSSPSPWIDDKLPFNEEHRKIFADNVRWRRTWVNIPEYYLQLLDIALIKIDQLPEGYMPVKIYTGPLVFREKVLAVGFGIHSRIKSLDDEKLRFSEQVLIGFVEKKNEPTLALQFYSPGAENVCYGDSGGPLFIKNKKNGGFELLGIINLSINRCANSAFATWPAHPKIWSLAEQWALEMNSLKSL